MWKARAEKWQREQTARDKLMHEVIQARHEQLLLQKEHLLQRQEQARIESLEFRRRIEEAQAAEAAEKAAREAKREHYKENLAEQVTQLQIRREVERQTIENEIRAEKDAQAAYEELLQSELARATRGETARLRPYQAMPAIQIQDASK
ncbi:hypothetical protein SeMB42_g07895 [Synchytrium endobioticum]|nr:hypothetical protein SeMB42_g07895 [Synchytrium endobioticum]